jgi:hypothetical protein
VPAIDVAQEGHHLGGADPLGGRVPQRLIGHQSPLILGLGKR